MLTTEAMVVPGATGAVGFSACIASDSKGDFSHVFVMHPDADPASSAGKSASPVRARCAPNGSSHGERSRSVASWAYLCALRQTMERGEHSLRSKKIVELVALLLPSNYAEAAIPARIDFNSANTAGFTKWWSNPAADDNCRSDIWP